MAKSRRRKTMSNKRSVAKYLQIIPAIAMLVGAGLWVKDRLPSLSSSAPSTATREAQVFTNLGKERRVMVVPNFLPSDLAEAWYAALRDAAAGTGINGSNAAISPWIYTTNNNGTTAEGGSNAKVRSRTRIPARRRAARELQAANQFAYSKWELERNHTVFTQTKRHFERGATRKAVRSLVAKLTAGSGHAEPALSKKLADLFVTWYRAGDFLSPHQDFYSGTVAFVLNLARGARGEAWKPEYGGSLAFVCEEEGKQAAWCNQIQPTFNTLVLFRTRSLAPTGGGSVQEYQQHQQGPMHSVAPVLDAVETDSFYRFALTGWFEEESIVLSEHDKAERAKTRSRGESGSTLKDEV